MDTRTPPTDGSVASRHTLVDEEVEAVGLVVGAVVGETSHIELGHGKTREDVAEGGGEGSHAPLAGREHHA